MTGTALSPRMEGLLSLLLLAAVVAVLALLLRWLARPLPSEGAAAPAHARLPVPRRWPWLPKAVALLYGLGGLLGLLILGQLARASWAGTWLDKLVWALLISQTLLGMYGGWQLWRGRARGAWVLLLLSCLCVPVLVTPRLSYQSGMGVALLTWLELLNMNPSQGWSLGFRVQLGYIGHMGWQGQAQPRPWLLGVNLVAIALTWVLASWLRALRQTDRTL